MRNRLHTAGRLKLFMSALVATVILTVPSSGWSGPTITEFASGAGPGDIAAGPDGNLWFVEGTANKIGRVTPAGVVTEFSAGLSGNAGLSGMALGPDGNLWFAESNQGEVGRITPAGVITEFSNNISGFPTDVAAGPDGNVWFTEFFGDRIGRITPAGVVTEFGIPGGNNYPLAITAGPDGNLWFTEYTATGGIGRITPTGVVTEFGPTSGLPYGIAAGPDGNLWFADSQDPGAIGRITTAGAMLTPFTTGLTTDGTPRDITAGADGNIYFTEAAGSGRLGRITPSGIVTEFSTGLSHAPVGIVGGGDGNIWFTEGSGNRVGRLTIVTPPVATTEIASAIGQSGATLNATINPNGLATTYHFEFGLTTGYGERSPSTDAAVGADDLPHTLAQALTGLVPGTAYHYRVVATNASGVTYGADQSFTTVFRLPPATRPVYGQSATIAAVSGTVLVGLPGRSDYLPLDAASTVPVGTTVDATAGTVRLTNVRDSRGKLQTGRFWGGSFVVRQARGKRAPTVLTLTAQMSCAKARHMSSVTSAQGKVRQLWGRDNHGRFVTRGRSAVATVRGTVWFMRDTCAGTLVKVTRGSVSVRDLVKHRTVIVSAGRSYLARLK